MTSGRRSGRNRLWMVGALVFALFAIIVPYATAVHDEGLFELDANAVDEAAQGDDWDTLVGGGGSANLFNMVQDPVENSADEIFSGGQTKDTEDLDAWKWTTGQPADKNDIQHAFAAAYEDPDNGHTIVYFGLDRLDSSGDAAAGFWFLKRPVEQVTLNGQKVFVYKGTNTLAEHSTGDVLVQSDFTNGGAVERIDAYGWGTSTGDEVTPTSPLKRIAEGADCDAANNEPPELCGQVNDGGEDVPANWPGSALSGGSVKFKGSGGVTNSATFNDATFLEGGIDLTSLFGQNVCTAQFLAETRQSQSETAVLDDKAEGDFDLCDIEVTKSGPEKSKVGDDASYEVKVKNTGAVTLYKQSIEDSLAGDLTDDTNPNIISSDCGDSLAPGATCTVKYKYTVQEEDPDQLENTVDVTYNRDQDLEGDSVTDSDSHTVNLFQPGLKITKTGDAVSKTGDTVTYNFEIENTSSADSPNLLLDSIDDTVLGNLAGDAPEDCSELAAEDDPDTQDVEDKCNFSVQHQVNAAQGAGEELKNTVTAHYHPDGFLNDITDSDDHTVDIVHPSVEVTKTGDAYSKTGDTITYTVTVKNTGDTALELDTITDSIDGDLADDAPAGCDTLAANNGAAGGPDECSFTFTHTVSETEGQGEELKNTVTAHYDLPDSFGLSNDITDSDDHTVDIVHPSYTVANDCEAGTEPVSQEGPARFTVKFTNTGDANLVITADNGIGQVSLAAGASATYTVTVNGPFSGQAAVQNTVSSDAVLAAQYNLPNTLKASDSGTCRVGSQTKVKKLTDGAVNPNQSWTFKLFNSGPHGDDTDSTFLSGTPLATGSTSGDADGVLEFGNVNLDPTKTYTLCELSVPAGWTVTWKVDTNADGNPDTLVTPFNPNRNDPPPQDLGNRCFDFGAGTGYPLTAGGTLAFEINNAHPGGEPRTIGYWKNWNTCTGGNQAQTAAKNGGAAAGFFLLDNVLNSPGIKIGNYTIPGAGTVESGTNKTGCQIAVLLLGKSDKSTGKSKSSDAAYELAAQLIAAKANVTAGAEQCSALNQAILDADALLASIYFNGTGDYLGSKVKGALATKRTQALNLANTLDRYNNGNLC
jgi:uncharacterized repeat protein (TIGR01451 family)